MQRARYIGPKDQDGAPVRFLPGVPARNLDEDDYAALDAEARKAVRESGLYDVRTDAEMKPPRGADKEGG